MRIVSAKVTRTDGRSFEAKLANLTPQSLFLISREPLVFRERVSVELLGVEIEGEVAFAVAEPRLGAVIVFHAAKAVRDVLIRHLDEIEVYALALGSDANARALAEANTPPLGSESVDLETVDEIPIDPDTLVPHDGAESEQAKQYPPDYTESPTPQNMPVIGAPDLYKRPPLLVKGVAKKKTPVPAPPAVTPPPIPGEPRSNRGAVGPDPVIRAVSAVPQAPLTMQLPVVQATPAPARGASRAKNLPREDATLSDTPLEPIRLPIPSPSASAELPVLEGDRCTVVFATQASFRAHYETTMMHGGIIVRAEPMIVGQQCALVLRVLSVDEHYSLIGRVAFNGKDGSVGFMIESFLHHRPMLEALANRSLEVGQR